MRRGQAITITALAVVLAGSVSTVTPAAAQQDARCTVEVHDIVVDPGLSTEPNSGVFHTHTEKGTIDCGGGRTGTIGIDGRYGTADPDSCQAGGEGWGVFSVTLGRERFKDTFTFKFGPNTEGTDAGEIRGERLTGRYTFTGDEGDCVSAPITKGSAKAVLTYKG